MMVSNSSNTYEILTPNTNFAGISSKLEKYEGRDEDGGEERFVREEALFHSCEILPPFSYI
jgi:hypothetical protein